uniref:Putative conserved secreted protein n=1 Tax=Rhipicephalus microplus TaxID=6941 RepID=A0A6G5A8B1_RHIMP
MLIGPTAVLFGALAGTLSVAWHTNSYYGGSDGYFSTRVWPKISCYYFVYIYGHGWEYRFNPDGTPCWLTPIRNSIGHCHQGMCMAKNTSEAPSCYDMNNNDGYATKCESTACNGMPCLNLFTRPRSSVAGICKHRSCVPFYDLPYEELLRVHPHQFHRCKDKEHHARNVLSNCHHYCKVENSWYHGYYSSNLSSACYLAVPKPNQTLGWCCKGRCIEMAHCLAS